MFVLTETAKAIQNNDSAVVVTILGIIFAVCLVLLVLAIVDVRR